MDEGSPFVLEEAPTGKDVISPDVQKIVWGVLITGIVTVLGNLFCKQKKTYAFLVSL